MTNTFSTGEGMHDISEKNRAMARQFNEYKTELAHLKRNRGIEILELKKEHKSVASAKLAWEATPKGQRYEELKALCEGLQAQMSAEKVHLRVLDSLGA